MVDPVDLNLSLVDGDELEIVGRSLNSDLLVSRATIRVGAADSQVCACPHCRRRLLASVKIPTLPRLRPRRPPPVLGETGNAFAALMYGTSPTYFVGALVTGWSLQRHSSLLKCSRILLCTDDVPDEFRAVLSEFWTIRPVEYIHRASTWFYWDYHNSRFKKVFTKLRVLNDFAGEFAKVVLLDLDLLIRGEVDSLFNLPAPAAMVRGQCSLRHGEVVPIDAFYCGHRQVLGINCGVMLVEPNAETFTQMLSEVEEHWHPEHWPSHGPEQDYLSRFYNAFGQWTNMSCRYNYQVHLTQYGSLEWHHYNRKHHPDVSVFHFSGRLVKPWEFVLDLHVAHNLSYEEIEEFVKEIPAKAAESMRVRISEITADLFPQPSPENHEEKLSSTMDIPTVTEVDDSLVGALDSPFCYGTAPSQRGSKRCYLDRYIHASWSEADSEGVIEWLRSFREADEATGHEMTRILTDLWVAERERRTENTSCTGGN